MEKLLRKDLHTRSQVLTTMARSAIVSAVFLCFSSYVAIGQIALDKCKFLGNVIPGSVPTDFDTYWNQVTPENAGKWESVEATQDNMDWANLDLAYNYAKDNNFPFKQHTFVWGQQQPAWMSSLTPQQQKEEVEEWIKLFCERYPDTDFIDVVNEPLHAPPGYANALGGSGTTGWDWVIWAFEKAREYCPNAKLALNDYNILNSNNSTDEYLEIVNLLKARNLIDIIGEQGHFLETTPLATISSNLEKFRLTGIPVHISEYDVNIADDNQQRDKLQEQVTMFWNSSAVSGMTLWGYKEGQIWRTDAYLVRSNGTERPALTWLKTFISNSPGGASCLTTGIEEEDHRIKIYPNPSDDGRFTIETLRGPTDVEIVDMQGKAIRKISLLNAQPVSVHLGMSPGMYLLKMQDNNGRNIKKLMIR